MSKQEFKIVYSDLLCQKWKEKMIWEHMKEHKLTAVPHFVGDRYWDSETFRLMVVGRAVNGWGEVNYNSCRSLENVVESVLNQKFSFADVVKEDGIDTDDDKYFYSRSAFWRLTRKILESYGEGNEWNRKVLWSNLYKVAPRLKGNPGWLLIRDGLSQYIKCIEKEIEVYKPTHILFITDIDYFDHYPNNSKYPSFMKAFNVSKIECDKTNYVVAKGLYKNGNDKVKILVCKRPEGKCTDDMIMQIKKMYDEM